MMMKLCIKYFNFIDFFLFSLFFLIFYLLCLFSLSFSTPNFDSSKLLFITISL